jgi:hypothetical protein
MAPSCLDHQRRGRSCGRVDQPAPHQGAFAGLSGLMRLHRIATRGTRQPRPLIRGTSPSRGGAPAASHQRRHRCGSGGLAPLHPTGGGLRPTLPASIEHPFASNKPSRTTPQVAPAAADRWTWLLLLAYVQLRLARDAVADIRLPWQPPLPPERRTPARVRRAFSQLLAHVGSPANAPKPCGRSPGRPHGKRSPPAPRFPAIKVTP